MSSCAGSTARWTPFRPSNRGVIPESALSFYCHASVMEEYARHLESHLGEEPAEGAAAAAPTPPTQPDESEGPDKKAILDFLNARISEIKALPGKLSVLAGDSEGIDRIVLRLEEITRDLETDKQVDFEAVDRDLAILDETLVGELRSADCAGSDCGMGAGS